MPRVYNTVSKPSPTAHLWNCSWAPGGLALLEGVLLTVPPAAMHATCPLQDITSVHSEPLPAVPSETLIMSPFVFRVWDFANSIATAELAPMSYWKREQEDFCCPCNELAPLWQEAEDRGALFLYSEEDPLPCTTYSLDLT